REALSKANAEVDMLSAILKGREDSVTRLTVRSPVRGIVKNIQSGVPFAEHGLFYFEDPHCRVWGALFSCVSHGPFALQEDEVSEV
ncbi:hypothetical protein MJM45_28800, partial [Salmonella enterica subsp. enterica serovar Kentucky]|nr:hypothetical protein [Salmonella enterica subsp. enterica serovar Kentucky]